MERGAGGEKRPRRRPGRSGPPRKLKAGPPQFGGAKATPGKRGVAREPEELTLRKIGAQDYAFFAPNAALERVEDIDEVHNMIAGDEGEIARDELLYLVSDCRQFLEAHNLLAELAVEEGDLKVARGHFAFAYELGLELLPENFRGRLPATKEYNPEFFRAGRGAARCLIALGSRAEGLEILKRLAELDPQEPNVRALLDELG